MKKKKMKGPKNTAKNNRYMHIRFKYRGEGLKRDLLVVYNNLQGLFSLIKLPGANIWKEHGCAYPGKLGVKDIEQYFVLFKRSAKQLDQNANIKEGKGNPPGGIPKITGDIPARI